jgi:hypothetical protein
VGGTVKTTSAGYFTRIVRAGAGAQFRVVDATTLERSPALVVAYRRGASRSLPRAPLDLNRDRDDDDDRDHEDRHGRCIHV